MKDGRPVQLCLAIMGQVPRVPRETARSVPPAGFGAAVVRAGIGNTAAREHLSRGTALRMLKRLGAAALRPAETGPRPCPDGFDAAYIEHGRDECEVIFRASHQTVTRWLEERGKKRLVKARAGFVAQRRAERRKAAAPKPKAPKLKRGRAVDPELARAAAEFLRGRPHRLVVLRKSDDSVAWWVDTKGLVNAAEMLAFAKARGFVAPANLTASRARG